MTSATTIINAAIESVIDLINPMNLFAKMTRGALGTGNTIVCEIGPTTPEAVFLDKHKYIPVDLTINGKHDNLFTLTEAMNKIHETLTMLREYPSGDNWGIVDVVTQTEPQIIGREENNSWMMASSLLVKVETFDPAPVPVPDEPEEPVEPVTHEEPDETDEQGEE